LMTADPHLNFNAAMDMTNSEFGVPGLRGFAAGMISAMCKKYFRLFCTTFLSWFNWRYLPLIAGLVYLLDRLYVMVNIPKLFVVGGFFLLFIAISWNARPLSVRYKKNKKFYKKLLTVKIAICYSGALNLIYGIWFYFFLFNNDYEKVNLNTAGIVFTLVIVLVILLFLTIKKILRISIEVCEQLDEQYRYLIYVQQA